MFQLPIPQRLPTGAEGRYRLKWPAGSTKRRDRSGGLANVSDSLGLVLMLMAGALAGLMVLTPARRRR